MTTFNQNIKRIGFACKWAEVNKKGEIVSTPGLNTGGTTLAWAKRNKRDIVEQKIIDVAKTNIVNTHNLLKKVATLPQELRMLRITSDMLSFYTHDDYTDFWSDSNTQNYLSAWFAPLGETIRSNDIRVSFHPDQFVVLASESEGIVDKSIKEFEYHADMARMMGFGKQFQDIKINVHISGRKGAQGIRDVYGRLSPEARNSLTIENEEYTHGLTDCLALMDLVPIVLDIHHNWVREGVYIDPNSDLVRKVLDSWHGVRPTCHYSVSREDILVGHDKSISPDRDLLMVDGHTKQKLRAHSDYFWNEAVNNWALSFLDKFDIMCESKGKNLASMKLHEKAKQDGII